MTNIWKEVFALDEYRATLEMLRPLGITLGKRLSQPMYYYWDDQDGVLVVVGAIIVRQNGAIIVRPRTDCHGEYLNTLIGHAENAFRTPPSKAGNWIFCRRKSGNYWHTTVIMQAEDGDPVTRALHAANRLPIFKMELI
ncbi:MAG: hypothetical protein QM286_13680 [Acidobacteriota bacterium]|nr:hypothetical protein [Acidobacteriota bacterium]